MPIGNVPNRPVGTDPRSIAQIIADFDYITNYIDTSLEPKIPTLVTALPGAPVDGQEVFYVADSNNHMIWHLRYRAAAPGSYKWEYVGGAGRLRGGNANVAVASMPNQDVILPLVGIYNIKGNISVQANSAAAFGASMNLHKPDGTNLLNQLAYVDSGDVSSGTSRVSGGNDRPQTTIDVAGTWTARFLNLENNPQLMDWSVDAVPVAVG